MEVRNEDAATVLFIRIRGFQAACETMQALDIANVMADIGERIRSAGADHGVQLIEQRMGSFVCVFYRGGPARIGDAGDGDRSPLARAKALATSVDKSLLRIPFAASLTLELGIASGPAVLLGSRRGDGEWAPQCVLAVHGGAAEAAEAMAGPVGAEGAAACGRCAAAEPRRLVRSASWVC